MLVQQLTKSGLVKGASPGDAAKAGDLAGSASQSGAVGAANAAGKKRRAADQHICGCKCGCYVYYLRRAPPTARGSGASSTLLGTTNESALDATSSFISKMLAGNAQANGSKQWQAGFARGVRAEALALRRGKRARRSVSIRSTCSPQGGARKRAGASPCPATTDGKTELQLLRHQGGRQLAGRQRVSEDTRVRRRRTDFRDRRNFRSYDSAADSFRDYVDVLRNKPALRGSVEHWQRCQGFRQTGFSVAVMRPTHAMQ